MKARRKARGLALQALYELDCTTHPLEQVIRARLDDATLSDDGETFVFALVNGVIAHTAELDALIQKYAPEWPLDQMAIIDKTVLRIAIWEFAISRITPMKVAINEAVELAKIYGSEAAARFVNGVLGTLVSKEQEIMREIAKPSRS
ncbi:MAG: transcription antitermination factor NusB [Chloroflexi bacterium]|nr:transcription antitermination factor NusB [Chloroflexota bacterium]MBI5053806.1 transcription antitermination factor NusB [Chloroflexota bacterium]MBI5080496.1 transcription antitermination factor NusB [Chloroflexota bacterium]MBI5712940.1 transcription antitermination factor NusB [Chloroflexota bacterium]